MVALGCQHKTIDQIAAEFNVKASQLLALFNKAMHKLSNACKALLEQQVEEEESLQAGSTRPLKSGEVMSGGKFVKESLGRAESNGEEGQHERGCNADQPAFGFSI